MELKSTKSSIVYKILLEVGKWSTREEIARKCGFLSSHTGSYLNVLMRNGMIIRKWEGNRAVFIAKKLDQDQTPKN